MKLRVRRRILLVALLQAEQVRMIQVTMLTNPL